MKQNQKAAVRSLLLGLGLLAFAPRGSGQVWRYNPNDLILGFRKNAPYTENYEVVVNIGQASNYLGMAIGTTNPVTGYSPSQLNGSFSSLNNLSWSLFGKSTYHLYPIYSMWLTVPRTNNAVQTAVPYRQTSSLQQQVTGNMVSVPGSGGAGFVSTDLGSSNQFNTPTFVREPIATEQGHLLSTWLAGVSDPTTATFQDTWASDEPNNGNVENTTSSSFSGTERSDLYDVRPSATNGPANYVGYFEFKSDGTMTFVRAQASTTPPAPVLSITRAGLVSTISFNTANGATYTLLFTNTAGLTAPASQWPSLPGTITGTGTSQSFQDTTSASNRLYRVRAQ